MVNLTRLFAQMGNPGKPGLTTTENPCWLNQACTLVNLSLTRLLAHGDLLNHASHKLAICGLYLHQPTSLGIRVSQVGEHISLGIRVSQVGENISHENKEKVSTNRQSLPPWNEFNAFHATPYFCSHVIILPPVALLYHSK